MINICNVLEVQCYAFVILIYVVAPIFRFIVSRTSRRALDSILLASLPRISSISQILTVAWRGSQMPMRLAW